MLLNFDDINNSIKFLTKENKEYPTEVAETMNTQQFNSSCKKIESQLNLLYEKIRVLQDLDSFINDYTKTKIKEAAKKLKSNLKIIEDTVDLYQDTNSVAVLVPMHSDDTVIRDRDGSIVAKMQEDNETLSMDSKNISSVAISSITREANAACYNSTYDNLISGSPGISCYYTNSSDVDNIREVVTVSFTEAITANHIEIAPVNAEIEDVYGILPNHIEIKLSAKNGYFANTNIIGIKIVLIAKNYTNVNQRLDNQSYDKTKTFGTYKNIQTRIDGRQTIKALEKTTAAANKAYIIDTMNPKYNTWNNFLQKISDKG